MVRKVVFVVAMGLMFGLDARGDDNLIQDVEHALTTLNQAFVKQDAAAVRGLLTTDHLAVMAYYGSPQTVSEELQSLPELRLTEYTPGDMKVTPLGPDAALVTYPLTLKGSFRGKPVPEKTFASAVWVRQDGHWREAFYQETPLDRK